MASFRLAVEDLGKLENGDLQDGDPYDSYCLLVDVADLSNRHLDALGVDQVVPVLHEKSKAVTLDLGWNNLRDDGATSLVDILMAPEYHRLRTIDLWANGIGAQGAKSIARLLEVNQNLTNLNLRKNNIGIEGAFAIIQALHATPHNSMQQLDLTMNGIDGTPELQNVFSNPFTLQDLTPAGLGHLGELMAAQLCKIGSGSGEKLLSQTNGTSEDIWTSYVGKSFRLNPMALTWGGMPHHESCTSWVYKGQYCSPQKSAPEDVAVKVLNPSVAGACDVARSYAVLNTLTRFIGVCERSAGERCIVTQWQGYGSLASLFDTHSLFHAKMASALAPLHRRVRICVDVAKALRSLHKDHHLVHTALSPHAVLVDAKHRAHLCSLRHAVEPGSSVATATLSGTARALYVAPEVGAAQPYCVAADVYSFGVICCELVANTAAPSLFAFNSSKAISIDCPSSLGALLEQCMHANPTERPDMDVLYTALKTWLKHLLSPGTFLGAVESGDVPPREKSFLSDGNSFCDDAEGVSQCYSYSESGEDLATPCSRHTTDSTPWHLAASDGRRVMAMALPLGGHPSSHRRGSTSVRSARTLRDFSDYYQRGSETERRLARELRSLEARVDEQAEQLALAIDVLSGRESMREPESIAQIKHLTESMSAVIEKLGTLEGKLQGLPGPQKGKDLKPPGRCDDITFLELADDALIHRHEPAPQPGAKPRSPEVNRADGLEALVRSVVQTELERREAGTLEKLQAAETQIRDKVQQLSARQSQLESQLQALSAHCMSGEPMGKGKLCELQDDLTALRDQLQTFEPMQSDIHSLNLEADAPRKAKFATKEKPQGHVSWEPHNGEDVHMRTLIDESEQMVNTTRVALSHLYDQMESMRTSSERSLSTSSPELKSDGSAMWVLSSPLSHASGRSSRHSSFSDPLPARQPVSPAAIAGAAVFTDSHGGDGSVGPAQQHSSPVRTCHYSPRSETSARTFDPAVKPKPSLKKQASLPVSRRHTRSNGSHRTPKNGTGKPTSPLIAAAATPLSDQSVDGAPQLGARRSSLKSKPVRSSPVPGGEAYAVGQRKGSLGKTPAPRHEHEVNKRRSFSTTLVRNSPG